MNLPRPIVAVGAVVIDAEGRVALVKRGKPPLAGHWTLPGGALELEETLAAATAREVFEETGLVVTVGPLVEVYQHVSGGSSSQTLFHYVILDYVCRPTGGVLGAGSDASDAAMVSESEFDRYGVNAATREVIGKARLAVAQEQDR